MLVYSDKQFKIRVFKKNFVEQKQTRYSLDMFTLCFYRQKRLNHWIPGKVKDAQNFKHFSTTNVIFILIKFCKSTKKYDEICEEKMLTDKATI